MVKSFQTIWGILCLFITFSRDATAFTTKEQIVVGGRAITSSPRERVSINCGWKFARFTDLTIDNLSYNDTLKPWILPSANDFVIDGTKDEQPDGSAPGSEFTEPSFVDEDWESVDLPHDWAIKGRKY